MIFDTSNKMSTRTRDLFQDNFNKSNQAIKAEIVKIWEPIKHKLSKNNISQM